MEQPGLTGLTEVVVTTTDVGPHLRLYRDQLGFEVRAEGPLPAAYLTGILGLPADAPVSATQLTAGGSDSGFIRLLQVPGPLPEARPHVFDGGLFDFDVFTRDNDQTYRQLSAAGYRWATPPQLWSNDTTAGVEVHEGVVLAPDGVNLVVVRPFQLKGSNAWRADPERPYSEMVSSVYIVADLDPEIHFWEALGLRIGADMHLEHPGIDRFLEMPAGSALRMLLFTARGSGPARVEVIQPLTANVRNNRIRDQRPGRWAGLSGWAIRVGDLEATRSAVTAGGGQCGEPVTVESAIHGQARVVLAESPAGVAIEFYQPE